MDPAMQERVNYLRILLAHLPSALPIPAIGYSDYHQLVEFQIDPAVLRRTSGNVVRAVCESLHAIFADDGKIIITERGPEIRAVTEVLTKYLSDYPRNPALEKWVKIVTEAAEKVYNDYRVPVRHSFFTITEVMFIMAQLPKITKLSDRSDRAGPNIGSGHSHSLPGTKRKPENAPQTEEDSGGETDVRGPSSEPVSIIIISIAFICR
jgi:hypothetical protein